MQISYKMQLGPDVIFFFTFFLQRKNNINFENIEEFTLNFLGEGGGQFSDESEPH